MMSLLPVNDAQNNLQKLIDQVSEQGKPVIIQGEHGNAVLLAEKDWSAIAGNSLLIICPWNARIYKIRVSNSCRKM